MASKMLGSLTYNAEKNVFLSTGYTSAAGHTYYKACRMSNRLVVVYDIGEGSYNNAVFLNGITLMCIDGTKANIIAKKEWGGCGNYRFFDEQSARIQSISMLKDFLAGQFKVLGESISESQLQSVSCHLIDEAEKTHKGLN